MRISDWSSDVCSSDLAPLACRVATLAQQAPCIVPAGPCFRQRDLRVDAEGQPGVLPCDAVAKPPVAGARGHDFQVEAGTVGQLVRLGPGLRVADRGIGQRHGAISLPAGAICPLARKSVVSGKSVSVRVDLGGRRNIKKKTK